MRPPRRTSTKNRAVPVLDSTDPPDLPPLGRGGRRDAASVQRHVPLLDPDRPECPDRGEVLRQADRCEHRRELPCGADPEQLQRRMHSRMNPDRTADGAERDRERDPSDEITAGERPGRQRLIVAIATASMPFMMPLLWVAARYASTLAKRDA